MTYTTLISPAELLPHLNDRKWLVVDCRFSLADPSIRQSHYLLSHIAGAVYAHVNEDLSGPILPGKTGRHPLPTVERAAETFSRLGIRAGVQVVAYDDMGGALGAARLWWMLRWLGHEAVAVLDGGWQRWVKKDRPVKEGLETRPAQNFLARPHPEMIAERAEVEAICFDPAYRLLDARSAERYRGENETIDPVAGHIPGALSAPYANNLTPEGNFCPVGELRARYQAILGGIPAENAIIYCGSGVSAAHDILAMVHAGLNQPRLYPGSWSEWITGER
jgi:thiosulfate/3-mercaptopyruvate sulfurtransferase